MIEDHFIINQSSDNNIYLPKLLMDKADAMGLFEEGNLLSPSDIRLLFGD